MLSLFLNNNIILLFNSIVVCRRYYVVHFIYIQYIIKRLTKGTELECLTQEGISISIKKKLGTELVNL